MTDPHILKIRKIFRNYMVWVPIYAQADFDDIGFIILKSICEANGTVLIGKKIFKNGEIIGDQVNYRYDGAAVDVAYRSTTHNVIISKRIEV